MKQKDKLRAVWRTMKHRCDDPRCKSYQRYGARGIKVCNEWHTFKVFYQWAIDSGYKEGLTIDRIDNDGNYEPTNCRWVTRTQQCRNKTNNKPITAWGETKLLVEWIEDPRCQVSMKRLWSRLERDGWQPEKAIATPKNATRARHKVTAWGETKTIPEWFNDPRCCLTSKKSLYTRLTRDGWNPELAMTTPA